MDVKFSPFHYYGSFQKNGQAKMRNIVSTNKVEMVKTQVDGKRSSVLVLKKARGLEQKIK